MSLPNIGIRTNTNADVDATTHRLITSSVNTGGNTLSATPDSSHDAGNLLYQNNNDGRQSQPAIDYQQLTYGDTEQVGGYRYQQQQQQLQPQPQLQSQSEHQQIQLRRLSQQQQQQAQHQQQARNQIQPQPQPQVQPQLEQQQVSYHQRSSQYSPYSVSQDYGNYRVETGLNAGGNGSGGSGSSNSNNASAFTDSVTTSGNHQQFNDLMYSSFISQMSQRPSLTQSQLQSQSQSQLQSQSQSQSQSQPRIQIQGQVQSPSSRQSYQLNAAGVNGPDVYSTSSSNIRNAGVTSSSTVPTLPSGLVSSDGSGYMKTSLQGYFQNNINNYASMMDQPNQYTVLQQPRLQAARQSPQQPLFQGHLNHIQQQQQQQYNQQQQYQQQPQIQLSYQQPQQQRQPQPGLMTQSPPQQVAILPQLQQPDQKLGFDRSQPYSRHQQHAGQGKHGGKHAKSGHAAHGDTSGQHPVHKKLSSTQNRIEKRKQLKKQGPKRPSSAYFLFSMSIRNELLREFPDAKVPELSKLASAKWKHLSDEEKKPYYDEFKNNWEKYRVLRDEYEKTLPPKRPSGPFIQFTQEIRPLIVRENPDKNLIEITKLIGEKWRNLNPVEKTKYTESYKKKLKEWEKFYPSDDEGDNDGNYSSLLLRRDHQPGSRTSIDSTPTESTSDHGPGAVMTSATGINDDMRRSSHSVVTNGDHGLGNSRDGGVPHSSSSGELNSAELVGIQDSDFPHDLLSMTTGQQQQPEDQPHQQQSQFLDHSIVSSVTQSASLGMPSSNVTMHSTTGVMGASTNTNNSDAVNEGGTINIQ